MSASLIVGFLVLFVVLYILAKLSKLLGLILVGALLTWLFLHPTGAHWRHQLHIGAAQQITFANA